MTDAERSSDAPEAEQLDLLAGPEAEGLRLDAFLSEQISTLSRTRVQRSIADGDVLVNGNTTKPSYRLRSGDRIEVELPEPPSTDLAGEEIPLSVIYEDEEIAVIDKPAGLVVHPGAGISSGTLANALVYRYGGRGPGPAWRPGIVHRLDRDTSGVMVVALTERAHASLSEQFQNRTVTKHYLALVYGRVSSDEGRLDKPIGRHPQVRVKMAIARAGKGRPAVTLYRVLERFDEVTYLDVQILTGRTHQIRVHLAAAGHPVVADEVYGKGRGTTVRETGLRRRIAALDRQFLHAARLEFDHPSSGERLSFSCQLPRTLEQLLEYCREHAR